MSAFTRGIICGCLTLLGLTINSRGFALDGRSISTSDPLQRLVVAVKRANSTSCTGIALNGGVVLTAAHCLSTVNSFQDVDGEGWLQKPFVPASSLQVIYYIGDRQLVRHVEAVNILSTHQRDVATLRVDGGHPSGAISIAPPIGWTYAEKLNISERPTLLVLGRGSHGEGDYTSSELSWANGKASNNLFAQEGFFIDVPAPYGACRGDSGSPIFLSSQSGVPGDVKDLLLVGILGGTWASQQYGPVDYVGKLGPVRHCSHVITASSLFAGIDAFDANAWLRSAFAQWNVLPQGQAGPEQGASDKDDLLKHFMHQSEQISSSAFRSPAANH